MHGKHVMHAARENLWLAPLMSSTRVIAVGRHVAAANGIVAGPIQIGTVLSLKTCYILPIEVNAFAIDAGKLFYSWLSKLWLSFTSFFY